jgi:NAD(P)-dependent dehydrogenase (short-subunit alcohol dehydrogenase family)
MANELSRRVAFITGGASGIGEATAAAFVAAGYATAIADRNEAAGRAVATRLGSVGECLFLSCDVSDDDSVRNAIEQTVQAYGRLDAAFNGAGIDGAHGRLLADDTIDNWQRVHAINLGGIWSCLRHEIRAMLNNGGGAIVNASSTAGLAAAPYMSAYVAAKHGVVGLTKAAAIDYARQGIRVNAVCPGMIDTPMMRSTELTPEVLEALLAECPIGRIGQPEEIASAVLWLCSDGASYLTGQAIAVDGAWTSR